MAGLDSSGRVDALSFAEAAGFLFQEKKSGELTVSSGDRNRKVVFYEGSPVAVVSSDPKDHIARILAVKGKISQEDAQKLQALPETKSSLQGIDFISQETITWGLKFRFVNLCYDLFRWTDVSFTFAEGPPPRDLFLMKIPTPTLLMKGMKHISPSFLLEHIPSDRLIGPASQSAESAGALGEQETALLGECREGKTIEEILEGGTVDPVRVREILYVLLSLGLVSLQAEEFEAGTAEVFPEEPLPLEEEAPAVMPLEEEAPPPPEGAFPPLEEGAAAEEAVPPPPEGAFPPLEEEPPAPVMEEEAPPPPEGAFPPLETEPPVAPAEEAPPPLEMEPTAAPAEEAPPEEAPAFEIERHSYEEEPPPAPPVEAAAEQPAELEAPGLEMPPPLEEPGELQPPGLEMPEPQEEPGLDMPSPQSPDHPPPPWQTQEAGTEAEAGKGGEARSPFASPAEEASPPSRREKRKPAPKQAGKPKKGLSLPIIPLIILAIIGAATIVGVGLWQLKGSTSSSSGILDPIPPPEKAGDLPVPPIPKLTPTTHKKPVKTPEKAAVTPPPAPKASPAPPAPAPAPAKKAVPAKSASSYEAGLRDFKAGNHLKAAETWKSWLRGKGGGYTTQVVVACQVNTVKSAFTDFAGKGEIFTVPLKLKDRTCYRVCMGYFSSMNAAQAAIDALPPNLRKEMSVKDIKSLI